MYRPTIRCSDVYKTFIDDVFTATTLDRNQIIRLALFTAAHDNQFKTILDEHKQGDVPIPYPTWKPTDHRLWMEQSPQTEGEGRDVNAKYGAGTKTQNVTRCNTRGSTGQQPYGTTKGRQGKIYRKKSGGIQIRIG